jgi:hypothetical protein
MSVRGSLLGTVLVTTLAARAMAVASPAWGVGHATRGCQLYADAPEPRGSRIAGEGGRRGCSDTVTYFWTRIYKVIDYWPDGEVAVQGRQYMQNGSLSPAADCDGPGRYYTHASTSTGLSGDSVESRRAELC